MLCNTKQWQLVFSRERPRFGRVCGRWLASLVATVLCMAVSLATAADPAPLLTLVDDLPGACRLAAPSTGQTLYILDEVHGSVVAIDPFQPKRRWTALAASPPNESGEVPPTPVAIGCIDSSTLVLVCRAGKAWSIRTHRLAAPGSSTQSNAPAQTLLLGESLSDTTDTLAIDLVVSPSREWLSVSGLPAPLPPVMRAPIAGLRVGTFSNRRCPKIPIPERPIATTISPFDEWVLLISPTLKNVSNASISFYSNAGSQRLLHLDTGLCNVRDIGYCRGASTLWGVAGQNGFPNCPEGLWRIDATMKQGRQVVQAECVARLAAPQSLVCLSERAIAVVVGGESRSVVLINPTVQSPAQKASSIELNADDK